MSSVKPTCLCPPDSEDQLTAKITNNLANLFNLMSNGKWTGNLVNVGACLCSTMQMLQALNNNVVSFFTWWVQNGGSGGGGGSVQAGVANLSANDVSVAVVFTTAFTSTPVITAVIVAPDNTQPAIVCVIDKSSITTAGFTVNFAGEIPAAGYQLAWLASQTTAFVPGQGSWVAAPASAAAAGAAGQVAYDGSYFYICIATNTWLRFAGGAW